MEIRNKNFAQYAALLQETQTSYSEQKVKWSHREKISKLRATIIRKYFKQRAGLDLDVIENSTETTWEKAVQLAAFVSKNIPHDNQKKWINRRNAITLWRYSRRIPTGFNCRWHAILLSELLLTIGIKNCFVTCLPKDNEDGDCHVVNLVWLPETGNWAMVDSDMTEYVVDENERPLSLKEMREFVCTNREFYIRALPGFENAWIVSDEGKEYMKCYWAKNLYWFARHTTYGFNLESGYCIGDEYICLVPKEYHIDRRKFRGIEITNIVAFWDL